MVTIFGKPTPQHVTAPTPVREPVERGYVDDVPEAAVTALYRERAHLVAHLAAYYPSSAGYTDEKAPEWLVVSVNLPDGQATWHIAAGDVDLFEHVVRHDVPWDGHSTAEKYKRVGAATHRLALRREMNEEGW